MLECVRLQIEFEELTYSAEVPMHETGIPNWGKQLLATATMRSPPTKTKTILSKCSGVLQPGQLTLVRS